MNAIVKIIRSYLSSIAIIFNPRYIKYLLYSGFVSLLFFIIAFAIFWFGGDYLTDLLTNRISQDWLRRILDVLTNFLAFIGLGFLMLLLYKYIVLIVVSPVMGAFSEKLEQDNRSSEVGRMNDQGFSTAYSTYRGIRIASRNIFKELFWSGILLFLSIVVPILSIIVVPLIFVIQAYYAGFGNMDVCIGRHLDVQSSIRYIKKNRLMVTVNGAIFLALLLIPILGAFLAPMLATSASTLSMQDNLNTKSLV